MSRERIARGFFDIGVPMVVYGALYFACLCALGISVAMFFAR